MGSESGSFRLHSCDIAPEKSGWLGITRAICSIRRVETGSCREARTASARVRCVWIVEYEPTTHEFIFEINRRAVEVQV